jgi:N-acetylglucosaminyldiphosphoundecaprenol N-acetyl-beta-D-mannosaminyltransferase
MPGHKLRFLGVDFDGDPMDAALDTIMAATDLPFHYVVTPNVHHIVSMHEAGSVLPTAYASAWKVYCDSRVLSRLARFCGHSLQVLTGSDLTAALIARASDQRLKVAIIGPNAADCTLLARRFPGLDIASYAPPMGFIASAAETQRCVDFILTSRTGLIFLAVGMPQQEILAQRLAAEPAARGVGLCIGASIDFLTSKQHRAPLWIQSCGLEWLHRLLSDPKRLAKRYLLECPKILPILISHLVATRLRP